MYDRTVPERFRVMTVPNFSALSTQLSARSSIGNRQLSKACDSIFNSLPRLCVFTPKKDTHVRPFIFFFSRCQSDRISVTLVKQRRKNVVFRMYRIFQLNKGGVQTFPQIIVRSVLEDRTRRKAANARNTRPGHHQTLRPIEFEWNGEVQDGIHGPPPLNH